MRGPPIRAGLGGRTWIIPRPSPDYNVPAVVALLALMLAGCTGYSRGERYLCFSPFSAERCKNPPYHYAPGPPPDARTKDDAVTP